MIKGTEFDSVFTYREHILGRFTCMDLSGQKSYYWGVLKQVDEDTYIEVRTLNSGPFETNIDLIKREFVHEVDVAVELNRRIDYENGNANTSPRGGPSIP